MNIRTSRDFFAEGIDVICQFRGVVESPINVRLMLETRTERIHSHSHWACTASCVPITHIVPIEDGCALLDVCGITGNAFSRCHDSRCRDNFQTILE